jgi:hypothetical protein
LDIPHVLPPHPVQSVAFALYAAVPYFPEGTIHVGVIDPGVGTERKGLAIQAGDHVLIGPDNGLLLPAARRLGIQAIHELADPAYFLDEVSRTFHGRDIFGPVRDAYRLTTEEMALLEPALVESLQQTFVETIHEGMETVVEMGVPEEAARAFVMGHLRIQIAVVFGMTDFPFSDAAQQKSAEAREELFRDDCAEILTRERTKESVRDIAGVR